MAVRQKGKHKKRLRAWHRGRGEERRWSAAIKQISVAAKQVKP